MFFSKSIHHFFSFLASLLFMLVVVSGCKVATAPQLPELAQMPDTYTALRDTTAGDESLALSDTSKVADLSRSAFFTDPHLVNLIDIALENNMDLLAAVERVEKARANYLMREGALWPSLFGVASANAEDISEHMIAGESGDEGVSGLQEEYFLGLQSSWEADIWGKLKNHKKAAYARLLASEKGKQLVTTLLVSEVARLYYELLAVDNELGVVRKNIHFQEIALGVIKIQKAGGRATELAVQQFTAQLLSTKALEQEMEQRVVVLENEINLLLGRYPQPIEREKDISELKLPQAVAAGVPSQLLLNRPDIQQAELELMATKADVNAARAAFLPSLKITPYIGFNAIKSSMLLQTPESLALGIIGGLTAPIFNKKKIRAEFNRSVAERKEAFYSYQQAIIKAYGEVITNLKGIENLEELYKLKEKEVNVLLNAVATSNDLFTSGYATYLEVITAQKSVLEAELELANIKKDLFHSAIGLYRALGGGWQ